MAERLQQPTRDPSSAPSLTAADAVKAGTRARPTEELMRRILQTMPGLIAQVNKDESIAYANDAAMRLLALTFDEPGKQSLHDFEERTLWEDGTPCPVDQYPASQCLRTGKPAPPATVGVRLKDGSIFWGVFSAIPLLDEKTGEVMGTVVSVLDITARKKAEEALLQAKADLEMRVAARTEELSRKNDELQKEIAEHRRTEAQLQEKQRFLRQLLNAHERDRKLVAYEIHDTFVQDVIGALMFVDAFHAKKWTADDPDWEEFARARKLLRKAIDEARRMISGLRPPIIDEQGIVAAIEYLVSELQERGREIEFQHSMRVRRLPPLLEAAIFRIVQEALSNLERHSGADYGQVKLVQESHAIRLVVSDFGVGFDPEHVAEGHFGLQGIKERTRLLGGTVTLRSAPGQGTDMIAEFPFVEDDWRQES